MDGQADSPPRDGQQDARHRPPQPRFTPSPLAHSALPQPHHDQHSTSLQRLAQQGEREPRNEMMSSVSQVSPFHRVYSTSRAETCNNKSLIWVYICFWFPLLTDLPKSNNRTFNIISINQLRSCMIMISTPRIAGETGAVQARRVGCFGRG